MVAHSGMTQRFGKIRNAKNFAIIQEAIDSLLAEGGEVYLPEGTYIITAPITLPSNITLCGAGKSTILRCADNTDINILYAIDKTNITIKDLTLDGNKANNIDAGDEELQNGIYLGGVCTYVTITNVTVHDTKRTGILIGYTDTEFLGPQKIVVTHSDLID